MVIATAVVARSSCGTWVEILPYLPILVVRIVVGVVAIYGCWVVRSRTRSMVVNVIVAIRRARPTALVRHLVRAGSVIARDNGCGRHAAAGYKLSKRSTVTPESKAAGLVVNFDLVPIRAASKQLRRRYLLVSALLNFVDDPC